MLLLKNKLMYWADILNAYSDGMNFGSTDILLFDF